MDVDDYLDPKVGVAVAATAMVFSPRAREVLHRGAVYGLAGIFAAGDAVASFTRGVTSGARRVREEREQRLTVADERVPVEAGTVETEMSPGETASGRRRRRTSVDTNTTLTSEAE